MSASEQPSQPSLRERKKEKFRQMLVDTATELFREHSVASTRIEDIAAHAEAAVTTVYNYFPNKHALVLAIIENQVQLAQERVQVVLDKLPKAPLHAFVKMIAADYGDMDALEDKRFWRELLAVMVLAVDEQADIELARHQFRSALKQATDVYIANGTLPADIDSEALVDIVYAIYAFHFRSLACSEAAQTAGALQRVQRDIKLLLGELLAVGR